MVAAGAVIGPVAPAFADISKMTVDFPGDFHPGDKQSLKVHAQGTGTGDIEVSGLTSDFDIANNCGGGSPTTCTVDLGGGSKDVTFTITAHQNVSVAAGQSTSIQVTVTGDGVTKGSSFKLFGPTATQGPTTVALVTGSVKDIDTSAPIAGAVVGLQDSASPPHNYSTTTDNQGRYSFRGTAASPIAPGIIAVDAVKDGYKSATKNANASAGQTVNFTAFTLQSTATTAPSAQPTDAGVPTPVDSGAAAAAPASTTSAKPASSGFSTMLIILGAVLVLLGVGAIVFILIRRRRDDGDDPDEFDDQGVPRGPTPVPASRGTYRGGADPTAVVRSGGYGDPTAVGAGGGMADAPTMMHSRPPVDPYGDAAMRSPQPGYGDGYGYDDRAGYGAGYEQRGGGYDDRAGYEQPRYDDRGGSQYGGGTTYGQPAEPVRGYEQPAGYDNRAGGYGGAGYEQRGGYDDRAGYERGGYDDRAGYGRQEPQHGYDERRYEQPAGYDDRGAYEQQQPRRGYDDRGGYEPPRGNHQPPDARRQLDWLDD